MGNMRLNFKESKPVLISLSPFLLGLLLLFFENKLITYISIFLIALSIVSLIYLAAKELHHKNDDF